MNRVQSGAKQAAHEAGPWIEWLARFGYAAKGTVYTLVGLLALQAAFSGRQATDSRGALAMVLDQPLGRALLAIIAVGLFGYALWRLVSATLNPENRGGWTRAAYAVTAAIYAGLALEAARLAAGMAQGGGGGDRTSHWTARALSQPLGKWLVVLAGLVIAGYGLRQLYKAYTVELDRRLDLGAMDPDARRWTIRAGRFGMAARGVVFGIIGIFLVLAALHTNPSEARGLGGALRTLERQPYGPWLLGVIAGGLVAYGAYEIVNARYRRIKPA